MLTFRDVFVAFVFVPYTVCLWHLADDLAANKTPNTYTSSGQNHFRSHFPHGTSYQHLYVPSAGCSQWP